MQYRFRTGSRTGPKWIAVLCVLAAAGTANLSAGRADEANAKSLLKAMSDYLAAQKAMSFDYDSNLEIVSTQQQKIGLASSGAVTLNRPEIPGVRSVVSTAEAIVGRPLTPMSYARVAR